MCGHPLLHHFYCGPRSLLISLLLSLWLTMTNTLSVVAQSVADKLVCSAASHWEIHHSRATQLESATSTAHGAVAHGTLTLRTVNTHMQSRCCRVRYLHSGISASISSIILSVSVYSPMYCTHTRTHTHIHILAQIPLMKQHWGVGNSYHHGNRRTAYSTQYTLREWGGVQSSL